MREKELERILKALANRRRLAILAYLKRVGEATVGEVAEKIHLSFPSTSRHLAILAAADIVVREQRGLEMWYCLDSARPTVVDQSLSQL
jgi:DNA-binding transcriptional ArsR family regulator